MKNYISVLKSILYLLCAIITVSCTIWDVEELREKSRPDKFKMPANPTPKADDFIIGNLSQIAGSITAVTITPKENKTTGSIIIFYNDDIILPENTGSYKVSFDVEKAEGWNSVKGLSAGDLVIYHAPGEFKPISAITRIYEEGLKLGDITLPNHYSWDYTDIVLNAGTVLNAGDGQVFPATYTDPSGNYGLARGGVTVNIAKADGEFIHLPEIKETYIANMTLADIDLPDGYEWNNPATILHAAVNQHFPANYTDPSGNYESAPGNIHVNVAKGLPLFLPHPPINIIYESGLMLSDTSLSAGYEWSNPSTSLNAGDGQQFQSTYDDPNGNYEIGSGYITVNVAKSDNGIFIHISPREATFREGLILADVVLPNNYEWNNPATILYAGNNQHFPAIYNDPSGNYTPVHDYIAVDVAKGLPLFIPHPPIIIVYEHGLTLADLSLSAGYKWVNSSTILITGNWQYQATFDDPNGNYEIGSGTIIVNVTPSTDGEFPHISRNITFREGLILADIELPNEYKWNNPAASIYTAGNNQHFPATYTDPSGNYESVPGNITVNVAKGLPLFIPHDPINIIFEHGFTLANISLSAGYEWSNPSISLNAGDGQQFQSTYDDPNGNYEIGSGYIAVNVAKSDDGIFIHISPREATFREGLILANIALPNNYEWSYPATGLNAGNGQSFPAAYTDPSGNYTPVHDNITVNVAKGSPLFIPYDTIDIIYEQGFTLANLSLSAGYQWVDSSTILNTGDGQHFPATYDDPNGNYEIGSGAITVNVAKASRNFPPHPAIYTTYTPTLTLANVASQLESNYTWVNSAESLNAGNDQQFIAAYDDPSGNYEIAHGEITVNVAKAEGAAVAATTMASRTNNSITINAVPAPGNGQFVEYAINSVDAAPVNGWQIELTFSGLSAGRIYYIFARSAENTNYNAGVALSAVIEIPNTGIDIGNPAVKLYLDGSLLVNGGTTTFNQASQIFVVSIDSGTYSEIVWYLNGSIVDQGTSRFTITLSRQIPGSFNIMVEVTSVSGVKNVGSHSFVIQ